MKDTRTVVIKIGTSTIMNDGLRGRTIDERVMSCLVEDVAILWKKGWNVAIVTSGAVGMGMVREGWDVQVAAMVGQPDLINAYKRCFLEGYGIYAGQLLLTASDFTTEGRAKKRVIRPLHKAFAARVIPLINENDGTSDIRNTLGDNDLLAARVVISIRADEFAIMSVKNSAAKGRGGCKSKIEAIHMVQQAGIPVHVVDGKREHIIRDVLLNGDRSGHDSVMEMKSLFRNGKMTNTKAFINERKKIVC